MGSIMSGLCREAGFIRGKGKGKKADGRERERKLGHEDKDQTTAAMDDGWSSGHRLLVARKVRTGAGRCVVDEVGPNDLSDFGAPMESGEGGERFGKVSKR